MLVAWIRAGYGKTSHAGRQHELGRLNQGGGVCCPGGGEKEEGERQRRQKEGLGKGEGGMKAEEDWGEEEKRDPRGTEQGRKTRWPSQRHAAPSAAGTHLQTGKG